MRTMTRYFIPLIASAGAAAFLARSGRITDPSDEVSNLPTCTSVGGSEYTGTQTTSAQAPATSRSTPPARTRLSLSVG